MLAGDSLKILKTLAAGSVDAVVTDPPYGLRFMGKKWDYDVPTKELWAGVLRVLKPGGLLLSFGGTRTYHRMVVNIEDAGFDIRDQIQWIYGSGFPKSLNIGNGFGTALKPANEPVVLARKPISESTVAKNVLKWGTGGINIEASRIGTEVRQNAQKSMDIDNQGFGGIARGGVGIVQKTSGYKEVQGRWPANVLFDEKVVKDFEWSRFFYCSKASKHERADNNHPTVKPIKLMEYLCRLITPTNGTVLDPFCGSGSTGVAAKRLGFKFIGIEREEAYVEIATKRIEQVTTTELKESEETNQMEMSI